MHDKPIPGASRLLGGGDDTGVRNRSFLGYLPLAALLAALTLSGCAGPAPGSSVAGAAAPVDQGAPLRLAGTVEATRSQSVLVPRLAGQVAPTLVITHLVRAGSRVEPGDLIVEFDRQEQIRAATERRAELVDLDGQIQKKRSEHAVARARDETELAEAQRNVERATIEARKNDLVPRIEAEKNTLAVEQATARFAQLKETFDLKRRAADAELRILEIQRERAERALKYSEGNALLMTVKAPFAGFVVLKQVWKGNTQAEIQEGEEVRPGTPIIDIVDPAGMQVRARVSQADVNLVAPGQPAKIRLDAYPELLFDGRVQTIAPLGVASGLTPKVRAFTAVVSINGMDPQLMPDLSASVEILPAPVSTTQAAALPARSGGH
jgi:HlyD family secretion protein